MNFWLTFVGFNLPSSRCTSSGWPACPAATPPTAKAAAGVLERVRHLRRVRPGRLDSCVFVYQHLPTACGMAKSRRQQPVGCRHARVGDFVAAAGLQLRACFRRSPIAIRSGGTSTAMSTSHAHRAESTTCRSSRTEIQERANDRRMPPHSPAESVATTRCSRRSDCFIVRAWACSSTIRSITIGLLHLPIVACCWDGDHDGRGIYGWAFEPAG